MIEKPLEHGAFEDWSMLDTSEGQALEQVLDGPFAFEPSIYCPQPVLCKGNGACATKCGGNIVGLAGITLNVYAKAGA